MSPICLKFLIKKEFWTIAFIFLSLNSILIHAKDSSKEESDLISTGHTHGGGGISTGLTEFPWLALLQNPRSDGEFKVICAGVLISEKHVLTAAHCVTGSIKESGLQPDSVRLGDYDITSDKDCVNGVCAPPPVVIKVAKSTLHPRFTPGRISRTNNYGDIAILELMEKVSFSDYIQPIALPPKSVLGNSLELKAGDELFVAGYERTINMDKSNNKQKLKITLFDHEECKKKFSSHDLTLDESQVCAGGEQQRETCIGPSGAPLMRLHKDKWILIGTVSFGLGCGLEGWPDVYSDVSYYADWISNNIASEKPLPL